MAHNIIRTILASACLTGPVLGTTQTAAEEPCRQQCSLTTDRPDTTEAALTVPEGLWQAESTLYGYSRDDAGGLRTETFRYGGLNLKYGTGRNTDVQLVFDAWTEERIRGRGVRMDATGFSDITLRLKHNMHGNRDDSGVAWALMPYVKIPTGTEMSNSEWEGGLIIPFGVEAIKNVLDVNWMAEADAVFDDESGSHEAVFLHSLSLAWSLQKLGLPENLGLFTEYVGETGSGAYRAYANGGITFGLTENVQLDAAVNIGLTEPATDFACFAGISFRF